MTFEPTLDMSARYPVPADIVWAALTKHRFTSEWWHSLDFPKRVGVRVQVQTPRPLKKRPRAAVGRVKRLDPGEMIQATLRSEPRGFKSELTITVTQLSQKTRVRIVEDGIPYDDDSTVVMKECRDGWREFLGALGDYLDDNKTVTRIRRHLDDA